MHSLPDLSKTVKFNEAGLVSVVIQNAYTGEVLTLAYANAEALSLTAQTGEVHLWSRSRAELWHKGATSGNVQRVHQLRVDCDGDAVLALVSPAGPACHTGTRSCFAPPEVVGTPAADKLTNEQLATFEVLGDLQRMLEQRKSEMPEGSYTTELLAKPEFAAEKVLEEAEEVTRAVASETDDRIDNESADLLYHLTALIASRDRTLFDALEILRERRG